MDVTWHATRPGWPSCGPAVQAVGLKCNVDKPVRQLIKNLGCCLVFRGDHAGLHEQAHFHRWNQLINRFSDHMTANNNNTNIPVFTSRYRNLLTVSSTSDTLANIGLFNTLTLATNLQVSLHGSLKKNCPMGSSWKHGMMGSTVLVVPITRTLSFTKLSLFFFNL